MSSQESTRVIAERKDEASVLVPIQLTATRLQDKLTKLQGENRGRFLAHADRFQSRTGHFLQRALSGNISCIRFVGYYFGQKFREKRKALWKKRPVSKKKAATRSAQTTLNMTGPFNTIKTLHSSSRPKSKASNARLR